MKSPNWLKSILRWPHPSIPNNIVERATICRADLSREPDKIYEDIIPILPSAPFSIYSNGCGTLHIIDSKDRVVTYVSYNDGSRFNAGELSPEMALGFAEEILKKFN